MLRLLGSRTSAHHKQRCCASAPPAPCPAGARRARGSALCTSQPPRASSSPHIHTPCPGISPRTSTLTLTRQKCASLASRGSRYHSLYTCTGRSIPIWLCHDTGISGNEPSNCSKCASGPNVSQIRFTSHTLSRLHSCFSKD
jgi:hypothetical protein